MISDIFINIVILVAFLSIGAQIFREKPITISKSLKARMLSGALLGLLGCLLMHYSVRINSNVLLDLRNITIIFSAAYFGMIPSVITGVVISIYRIIFFGISRSSIIALLTALLMSTGCGLISIRTNTLKRKWMYCTIYTLVTASLGFLISIRDIKILLNILIYYWIATIFMAVSIYFYIKFLDESGKLYRRYRDDLKKDFLTGLKNARQFNSILDDIESSIKTNPELKISLFYLDIDFFKKVNDTYGHVEGDIVLKEFSKILISNCSVPDSVFRIGGEEFAIVLLNLSLANALQTAERIRKAVEAHDFILSSRKAVNVTVSIGISAYPNLTGNIEQLVEDADKALYTAKRTGRNKVVLSDNIIKPSNP